MPFNWSVQVGLFEYSYTFNGINDQISICKTNVVPSEVGFLVDYFGWNSQNCSINSAGKVYKEEYEARC